MRTRRNAVVVFGALVATAILLTGFSVRADVARKPDNAAAMVTAAKEALRDAMAGRKVGKATIEDVYQWSRRLMTAEQYAGKADAGTAHLERMSTLHEEVAALFQAETEGVNETKLHASKFYFLEAQAMAAKQAK